MVGSPYVQPVLLTLADALQRLRDPNVLDSQSMDTVLGEMLNFESKDEIETNVDEFGSLEAKV